MPQRTADRRQVDHDWHHMRARSGCRLHERDDPFRRMAGLRHDHQDGVESGERYVSRLASVGPATAAKPSERRDHRPGKRLVFWLVEDQDVCRCPRRCRHRAFDGCWYGGWLSPWRLSNAAPDRIRDDREHEACELRGDAERGNGHRGPGTRAHHDIADEQRQVRRDKQTAPECRETPPRIGGTRIRRRGRAELSRHPRHPDDVCHRHQWTPHDLSRADCDVLLESRDQVQPCPAEHKDRPDDDRPERQ